MAVVVQARSMMGKAVHAVVPEFTRIQLISTGLPVSENTILGYIGNLISWHSGRSINLFVATGKEEIFPNIVQHHDAPRKLTLDVAVPPYANSSLTKEVAPWQGLHLWSSLQYPEKIKGLCLGPWLDYPLICLVLCFGYCRRRDSHGHKIEPVWSGLNWSEVICTLSFVFSCVQSVSLQYNSKTYQNDSNSIESRNWKTPLHGKLRCLAHQITVIKIQMRSKSIENNNPHPV